MATQLPRPTTALVLAGGKGERLRPLTDSRPKPMVEVNGVPIVEHHLRWLSANGVRRAVLLTGYLHEVIDDYFAVPRVDGLTVDCIAEERPLGRGGALRRGFELAGIAEETVIATNGDVLTDQAIAPMVELHHRMGAAVTLMLTQMSSPYGVVWAADDGRVMGFDEKPLLPYWINAGVYVVATDTFAQFPEEGDHETSTFPALAAAGRIVALRSVAFWRSVESAKELREVTEYFMAR